MREIKPVFIFSLPRSGSTLLQRAVAAHPAVSTVSEPWVLLPLLYYLRDSGIFAEYSHKALSVAARDLLVALPSGEDDYLAAMREGVQALYARLAEPGATHFVDKTPRYHLVCEDIIRMFPEAKFIFLWRNPLAVVASMTKAWSNKAWQRHKFELDLEIGLFRLISAFDQNRSAVHSLRYEDLVQDPQTTLARVFDYLELEHDWAFDSAFTATRLAGHLGDKDGVEAYDTISTEPLDKWTVTINNAYRAGWCKRYLDRLGVDRLSLMGYDHAALQGELAAHSTGFSWRMTQDGLFDAYGWLENSIRRWIVKKH